MGFQVRPRDLDRPEKEGGWQLCSEQGSRLRDRQKEEGPQKEVRRQPHTGALYTSGRVNGGIAARPGASGGDAGVDRKRSPFVAIALSVSRQPRETQASC